jgi:predicted negative regulator of RcsB-dependent stress response
MLITPLLVSAALALQSATPQADKDTVPPALAGTQVEWARTWDEAVTEAKKLKDPRILVEFVDEKCGDCVRIERLVIPNASFAAYTRDKVPLRLKYGSPEAKKLTAKLGVDSLPAWAVVTPELLVSAVLIGSTNQAGWFETFSRAEVLWREYKKKLAAEQANPGDEELVFSVAEETFKRGGDGLAEPRFRRLVKSAKPELRERSLAYLASIELDSDRVQDAARDLDDLLASVKDPVLRERAEFRRAEVEIALGRRDLAAKRLAAFKKDHPGSELVKDADVLLQRLETH